jgi:hypothetical protein
MLAERFPGLDLLDSYDFNSSLALLETCSVCTSRLPFAGPAGSTPESFNFNFSSYSFFIFVIAFISSSGSEIDLVGAGLGKDKVARNAVAGFSLVT